MGALTHNGEVLQRLPADASQINYDNTSSGMAATQVQAAVDELKSGLTSVDNLNHINMSFNATTMQGYLRQVIDTVNNEYPVGTTINIYGAWLGACMFIMQASRTLSNQTIVSAIPQPGNISFNKMWIGMKEDSTYTYSTIDMVIVN